MESPKYKIPSRILNYPYEETQKNQNNLQISYQDLSQYTLFTLPSPRDGQSLVQTQNYVQTEPFFSLFELNRTIMEQFEQNWTSLQNGELFS